MVNIRETNGPFGLLLFLVLTVGPAWADTQDVLKYHVDLSLLGKIGHVDIVVDTRDDEYEIQMNAEARGVMSGLASGKNITFVSRGEIVDGRFISNSFEKTVDSEKKRTSEIYLFDHKEKKVILFKEKVKRETGGPSDVSKIGGKEQPEYVYSRETKTLDHYSDYDTLSFLLNLQHFAENGEEAVVSPVGMKKEDQTISLHQYDASESDRQLLEQRRFEKILLLRVEKDDRVYEALLGLDEKGYLQEAVTRKDIFPIGQGRVQRNSYKRLKKVEDIDD